MTLSQLPSLFVSLALFPLCMPVTTAGEPLKVYILAGQSNMQGKARVRTIERLKLTEDAKGMYTDMMGEGDVPLPVKDVHGIYFTSGRSGSSH